MNRLVTKAQKGDDKAFLKLFQKYEQDIYRMAYVYVKNKDDALDVVQEVAYRSFTKIETLKNPQYFKTWLMKITINCSVSCIRKNKKVVHLKREYEEFIPSESEDISLSISLKQLLDYLNEEEKSIIILRFYKEYTLKEIGEVLNIPLGTVKTLLYRSLEKLRKKASGGGICGK
ncbi:RNA polymerase sigma factor [Evansella cellulosilytica]|uniref:RNA polymerase, sigma 32 subunit, RpoH n=1 Tax=Evansella cellulosilytica (strain ATCC 21833 / DSM 2522 / FERM P-1141 / JCM 9156 / N-4) TaxID=649639 RepID=E6U1Y2_EVAC2|nr:sigma-70 family RNA polymerase sigma factor [Evansella cellulosilytica]ADU29226.1 RNA polymerase, sigma 32 subunit, RpoH [Evansella cellulosilytica DSM 2522]